jgi:hypothetical protein
MQRTEGNLIVKLAGVLGIGLASHLSSGVAQAMPGAGTQDGFRWQTVGADCRVLAGKDGWVITGMTGKLRLYAMGACADKPPELAPYGLNVLAGSQVDGLLFTGYTKGGTRVYIYFDPTQKPSHYHVRAVWKK